MLGFSKRLIKTALNIIGLDVVKTSKSPIHSLLGLRHLPFHTIIDVGANEGQFAKMISKYFPNASIYCFEPLPAPFKKLSEWAESQNGRNKVFNIALGDTEGVVEMFSHLDHSPSSSFLRTTKINEELYPFMKKQTSVLVPMTTLDKIVVNLPNPLAAEMLIKLDVQGYEDRIIRGGTETFRKARACILEVGLDALYEEQATFGSILSLLHNLGFHYIGNLDQAYADDGHVIYIDAVFANKSL